VRRQVVLLAASRCRRVGAALRPRAGAPTRGRRYQRASRQGAAPPIIHASARCHVLVARNGPRDGAARRSGLLAEPRRWCIPPRHGCARRPDRAARVVAATMPGDVVFARRFIEV
jgi:hypothetical protein